MWSFSVHGVRLGGVLAPHLLVPVLRRAYRRLCLRQPASKRLALGLHSQTRQVRLHSLAALPEPRQRRALPPVPLTPLRRQSHAPLRVCQRFLVLPQSRVRSRPVAEQHVVLLVHADSHRELLHSLRVVPGGERGVTLLFGLRGHLGELGGLGILVVAAGGGAGAVGGGRGARGWRRCRRGNRLRHPFRRLRLALLGPREQARHRERRAAAARNDPRGHRTQELLRRGDELALLRVHSKVSTRELERSLHRAHRPRLSRRLRGRELRDAAAQVDRPREQIAVAFFATDGDVSRGLVEPVAKRRVRAPLEEERANGAVLTRSRGAVKRGAVRVVANVRGHSLGEEPAYDVYPALCRGPVLCRVGREPEAGALAPRVEQCGVLRVHRLHPREVAILRRGQPRADVGLVQRVHGGGHRGDLWREGRDVLLDVVARRGCLI
mmetsp:Transcript_1691/g.6848  ORF Transcript_1691/g.6848 Transcript_1691/m.6848 type:complete len:437 (-) Transcript_1691:602-1912(-)